MMLASTKYSEVRTANFAFFENKVNC